MKKDRSKKFLDSMGFNGIAGDHFIFVFCLCIH